MPDQNIYTVGYGVRCPDGSGEPIAKYLNGLFSRIASQVIAVREPVDWLVVKSEDLLDITFGSQNFFEGKLEEALRNIARPEQKISVMKDYSIGHIGTRSNKPIEEWIQGKLKENFRPNYLNEPNLGLSFVGYHLDMRQSS
jgi:hypothetical protein